MVIHYNGMSNGVDASTSCATGQLGELARGQANMSSAIEFFEFFDHHATRRHIDAQCQRFCCENHLDQALFKQTFDDLAEQCDHSRMVWGKSLFQSKTELREMQRFQILLA